MLAPIGIAAVDAGSNAIRAGVARVSSATDIRLTARERAAVRLGHLAFTHHRLNRLTIARAVEAFRSFRRLIDHYNVKEYRAVATSAVREARNRDELIRRIYRETGIRLDVIDSAEEARLVRSAVVGVLPEGISPRLIIDLGGGSLEISVMRGSSVERNLALPLGTVRLMETFGLNGAFTDEQFELLRHHVLLKLKTLWPKQGNFSRSAAVACGGNAEALARLAPGARVAGLETLNLRLLREHLWDVLGLDVPGRMKSFGVRRDRAEVIGIATVVFCALADWLKLPTLVVPGVGVREGILRDLALEHFGTTRRRNDEERGLLEQVRRYAARLHCELTHAEHVRRLAASLFDQLAPVHHLPSAMRLPLELAALLHDVGLVISAKSHHKHGEYVIRHAHIPGLSRSQQNLVACLVRYHSKPGPEPHHKLYASLAPRERHVVRELSAILRIAVGLDAGGARAVRRVEVRIGRKVVQVVVYAPASGEPQLGEARRKTKLFAKEFGLKIHFSLVREPAARSLVRPATHPTQGVPSREQRPADLLVTSTA